MTDEPHEHEIDKVNPRKVMRTLLESDSPDLQKIRELLAVESKSGRKRKVAKTLIDADEPLTETSISVENANSPNRIAKTIIEAPLQSLDEPVHEARRRQRFVAKTMLDSAVLTETLLKFESRKEQRAVMEARSRADQPVVQITPIAAKRQVKGCPWVWTDDDSSDKFRYCSVCKVTVYDFRGLAMVEAESIIFTRENKKAPTLYQRLDRKYMTQDCPVSVKKRHRMTLISVVGVIVAVVAVVLLIVMPSQPQASLLPDDGSDSSPTAAGRESERTDPRSGASKSQPQVKDLTSSTIYEKMPNGTIRRKRPTFTPEDKGSYWE